MSMRKTRGKTELEEDDETAATKEVTAASAAANESGEGGELDLSYLDWWSKYFHSMMLSAASASGSSSLNAGQRKNKTVASAFIKGINEDNENDPPASDIDNDDKSDAQSQSDTSSKKRKKKNRKNSALISNE